MAHPAQLTRAIDQPEGVVVVDVTPLDRRVVTGSEAGPDADSTFLADEFWHIADTTSGPIVVNLSAVDWIDSGACAVLIRFWKDLRGKGRVLTLAVTDAVRETFIITGLVRLIQCFGDLNSAIEAARTAQPLVEAGKRSG